MLLFVCPVRPSGVARLCLVQHLMTLVSGNQDATERQVRTAGKLQANELARLRLTQLTVRCSGSPQLGGAAPGLGSPQPTEGLWADGSVSGSELSGQFGPDCRSRDEGFLCLAAGGWGCCGPHRQMETSSCL